MSNDWVGVADESFDRATNLPALYASGIRVLAGYAGPGSSGKHLPASTIKAWAACGPGTGILALCEGTGTEPVTSPSSGAALARSARSAWRALGLPDAVPVNHAVDRNVSESQWQGPVAAYFAAAAKADTTRPTAYVERDAGVWLTQHGHIAGFGAPAAYGWDSTGKLVTPANAPAACFWTQERNDVREDGGVLDIGHVRAGSPYVWWLHETEDDMQLTDKINLFDKPDVHYSNNQTTVAGVLASTNYYTLQTRNLVLQVVAALADPGPLAAAVAAAMPTGTTVTEAQLQAAFVAALTEMAAGADQAAGDTTTGSGS